MTDRTTSDRTVPVRGPHRVPHRVRPLGPDRPPHRRTAVELEVAVPAFNEAARLPDTLRTLTDFLGRLELRSRVVVVDNGSTDGTAAVVREVAGGPVDVAVIGCARAGKGAAVRRGLATSGSRYVGFLDADLSTPVGTLAPVLAELRAGATAVIASRHAPGAKVVLPQPLRRRLGGTAFRLLARPLVPDVHDTQCGFKFFEREAVQRALGRCRVDGFAFDVDLLRQVWLDGGRIVEVAVSWTDDTRSTFRAVRDGGPAFADLLRLYQR